MFRLATPAFAFLFLFCLAPAASKATIYRIGYPGAQVAGMDFQPSAIASAMTAAAAGDTLQLYQQYWASSISSVTVTKPLKFIGYGYYLNINTGLQAHNLPDNAQIGFVFNAGSAGTVIAGVNCGQVDINTSNITISRSRVIGNFSGGTIRLGPSAGPISNLTIEQSVLGNFNGYNVFGETGTGHTNINIRNSIIIQPLTLAQSIGSFFNNVALSSVSLASFMVKNSIFTTTVGACPTAQNTYQNNLFAGNCTNIGTNNQYGVNMNNVFTNWNSGSFVVDSQLTLKAGSPAINAGLTNSNQPTDAGIFGGEPGQNYRLSGIPPVPSIYSIVAPATASGSTYNVNVSVRGNN